MADMMYFPKSFMEFIKGYSFKDSDEVYTNGAELIPVFRVEQAVEHYEAEIRNKAIDEFFDELKRYEADDWLRLKMSSVYEIAEQMKGGD